MMSFFKSYDLSLDCFSEKDETIINIFGELLGAVYERKVLGPKETLSLIKELANETNKKKLKKIIRSLVGQCVIEIKTKKCTELWASCSSSGFIFGIDGNVKRLTPLTFQLNHGVLYCSNNEGKFYRTWKKKVNNAKIFQDAIMNAVISHQSVIRPPFDGLFESTYRCQPGCLIRIKPNIIEIEPYIILDKDELMIEEDNFKQEADLNFAIDAVISLYKKNQKDNSKYHISFSGGIDSTSLMLALKEKLTDNSLIYINHEKKTEEKLASFIAEHEGLKLRVIDQNKKFDIEEIRELASSGLSTLNSLGKLKHNFASYRFLNLDKNNHHTVVTGQNADTLFHVDHFGPDNRVNALTRAIKILRSIKYRKLYTMPFYRGSFFLRLLSFFRCSRNKKNTLGMLVMPSLINLAEHNYPFQRPTINKKEIVLQSVVNYKVKKYYEVFLDYYLKKYDVNIDSTKIKDIDPRISNHIVRTIRWFRTVGSFHQQFQNISYAENVNILATYSEGPLVNILLNWELGFLDLFSIKRFSQLYIKRKLGISYSQIRMKALGVSAMIKNNLKSLIPFKSILKRFLQRTKKAHITIKDLHNLRDILSHKNGIIERKLLDYINDNAYRDHLNYLYDCLEIKVATETLSNAQIMQICRLINLQIMLETER